MSFLTLQIILPEQFELEVVARTRTSALSIVRSNAMTPFATSILHKFRKSCVPVKCSAPCCIACKKREVDKHGQWQVRNYNLQYGRDLGALTTENVWRNWLSCDSSVYFKTVFKICVAYIYKTVDLVKCILLTIYCNKLDNNKQFKFLFINKLFID